ncbi:uncharacterized protein LOC129718444 [Wyeomyia smithii]|uniref:uncharacterized protein LOC129718444 n=1 Tax=Wyeomyia smithii TaxID=174621 RepID=UPI002467C630|nr:uncharacterized protein LOC129718444 [Wyeomyia smithii]
MARPAMMPASVLLALTTVVLLVMVAVVVESISITPENNHHYGGENPAGTNGRLAEGHYPLRRYASAKGVGRPSSFANAGGGEGRGGGGFRLGSGPKKQPPRLMSRVDNGNSINSNSVISPVFGNQTADRYRRLIPYMTFYIPTPNGDYSLPINQAYNYMPIRPQRPQEQPQHHHHSSKLQILSLQQHQRQPQQSGTGIGGDPPLVYQSYQPQNHQSSRYQSSSSQSGSPSQGPSKINNYPGKYEYSHRPQHQPSQFNPSSSGNSRDTNLALIYSAKAQLQQHQQQQQQQHYQTPSSKLYAIEVQSPSGIKPQPTIQSSKGAGTSGIELNLIVATPASVNEEARVPGKYQPQPTYQQYAINPFLPSNKLPGHFTPIHNGAGSPSGHQTLDDDRSDEVDEDTPPQPRPSPVYTQPKPQTTYVILKPSHEPNQLYYQEKPTRPSPLAGPHATYKEKPNYLDDSDVYNSPKYAKPIYLNEQEVYKPITKSVSASKPGYIEEPEVYKPIPKSQLNFLKSSYLEGPEFYKPTPKPIPIHKPSYYDDTPVYKPAPKPVPIYKENSEEHLPSAKPIPVPIPLGIDYSTPRPVSGVVEYSTPRPHPASVPKESHPNRYIPAASPPQYPSTVRPKFSVRQKPAPKHNRGSTKVPTFRQHLTENLDPSDIRSPSPSYYDHYPDYKSYVKPNYYPTQANYIPAVSPTKPTKWALTSPNPNYQQPRPVYQHHKPQPVTPTSIVETASTSGSTSLADLLKKLQDSNHLPKTLTPENIDNSIRTLVKILNNLKETQQIHKPPSHDYNGDQDHDYDYQPGPVSTGRPGKPIGNHDDDEENDHVMPHHHHPGVGTTPGPNSGRPGIDYPNLSEIPATSFSCKEQRYKGFFGDPETNCQVWHYCDLNGGKASFLCPNGTIFSQVALTCDWWFNVKCSTTAQLYVLNERLYKYILPFTPKFPEDYSGPLVDKYLAIKFQEMEDKMKKQRAKGKQVIKPQPENENDELNGNKLEDNDNRYNQNQPHPIQYVTENSLEASVGTAAPISPSTPITLEDINSDFERTGGPSRDDSSSMETGDESNHSNSPIVVTAPSAPASSIGAEDDDGSEIGPVVTSLSPMPLNGMSRYALPDPASVRPHGSGPTQVLRDVGIEVKNDGTSGHLTPSRDYEK